MSSKPQPRGDVNWTTKELKLVELILRMLELDPTLAQLEETFDKGLRLVRRLRDNPLDDSVEKN